MQRNNCKLAVGAMTFVADNVYPSDSPSVVWDDSLSRFQEPTIFYTSHGQKFCKHDTDVWRYVFTSKRKNDRPMQTTYDAETAIIFLLLRSSPFF